MKKKIVLLLAFFISGVFVLGQTAQKQKREISDLNLKDGVAIKGYDPVAYFSGEAKKGTKKIAHTHEGVTYYFASEDNREAFKKSPSKYEPQFGGWCAYALAKGPDKVKVNPKSYKIIDEKLYLFYDTVFADTLTLWNEEGDDQKQIESATKSWELVLKK